MGLMDILSQYAGQALSGGQAPAAVPRTRTSRKSPRKLRRSCSAAASAQAAGRRRGRLRVVDRQALRELRLAAADRACSNGSSRPQAPPSSRPSPAARSAISRSPARQAQQADADAITPAQAGELAAAAKQSNPGIVSELGSFYSQHPTLVKTLGAAALAIAMSHMASHT